MAKGPFSTIRRWHDRVSIVLTMIAIPSIVRDLAWWISTFQWLLKTVPAWVATALIWADTLLSPVLTGYRDFMAYLFSFSPFDLPFWVSSALPPLAMISIAALASWMALSAANHERHQYILKIREGRLAIRAKDGTPLVDPASPTLIDDLRAFDGDAIRLRGIDAFDARIRKSRRMLVRTIMLVGLFGAVYSAELLYILLSE